MTEAFLHYLFNQRKLGKTFKTISGEILEVIDFGMLNKNAGPDFLAAKVKIGETIWAGHIEFHLKSSDWIKHKHQNDPAYENVIAHFVLEHDAKIYSGNYLLPEVELKHLISPTEIYKYENFVKSASWISCESQLKYVNSEVWEHQKKLALEQRLQRKKQEVLNLLKLNNGDKQKTLLILLGRSFGGKVNAAAFETLCTKIQPSQLSQLNYDMFKIQALLHGLSGLLPQNSQIEYVNKLSTEFNYQKRLFDLKPMSESEWRFSSLRPASSPSVRIAQLAVLITQQDFMSEFSYLNFESKVLFNIQLDSFWDTHYNFQNKTRAKSVQLSANFITLLTINCLIPFRLACKSEQNLQEAIKALQTIAPEVNSITKKWKSLGLSASSAFDTQALLEQKNEFCNQKKCLFCTVGKQLLNL